MQAEAKIYVAGHTGMVGSAVVRKLNAEGYANILTASHADLELTDQSAVERFLDYHKPDYIILAAAKVGGIQANNAQRAEFIYQNLAIETNIIHSAWKSGVSRLLFLGSSCIYPRDCQQPIREDYLLCGPLEYTNEPYAIAKIAGLKMCESYNAQYGTEYVSLMPTNLYGPNDNYNLNTSHVLPALLRKAHEAKLTGKSTVEVWGTGTPRREFLHVDDLAAACLHVMRSEDIKSGVFNIGTGSDISIRDLAELILETVELNGTLVFNHSKPDGTPRKLLDVSRISSTGWKAKITLEQGLRDTYENFKK